MNMQDNELDELFRSKLGSLEMQPAAHIWDNINAGLGGEKKRAWTPRLSVAATLLLMLSVGAWFMMDKPAKVEQGQVASRVTKPNAVKQTEPENQTERPVVRRNVQPGIVASPLVNNIAAIKHQTQLKQEAKILKEPEVIKEATLAIENDQTTQVLAAVPASAVTNPVVPEMTLSAKTIDIEPTAIKTVNPVAPAIVMAQQPEKKKKRGIHSLGGIINAVVAAVDKREDKFIEFTETDEDNANITGLNLGLIKVKKEK